MTVHKKIVKDKRGYVTVAYWESNRPNKKWSTRDPKTGKLVHFGDKFMQDYTQHHSLKRRKSFRSRMSGIKLKSGKKAIDKRFSPAWLSFYVLW